MWKWISCYLSGKHEFGVSCEPGNVFLRCVHCGKRSQGWAIHDPQRRAPLHTPSAGTMSSLPKFDSPRTARGQ